MSAEKRLENACDGKSHSQKGLNLSDMRKYLAEQGIKTTHQHNRKTVQSFLCQNLSRDKKAPAAATLYPVTETSPIDDSEPIKTTVVNHVYDETNKHTRNTKQALIQRGFLVEKTVWITTPAYETHRQEQSRRSRQSQLETTYQWMITDQRRTDLNDEAIPGWVISLLVHGTANGGDEPGDVRIWLSDYTGFDQEWMEKIGTVDRIFNGRDGYDSELKLNSRGLDYYTKLGYLNETHKKQIPQSSHCLVEYRLKQELIEPSSHSSSRQWMINDQALPVLNNEPIPGWVISLLVNGLVELKETCNSVQILIPDAYEWFDSIWMRKIGTLMIDDSRSRLKLNGKGLDYYEKLHTLSETQKEKIPSWFFGWLPRGWSDHGTMLE